MFDIQSNYFTCNIIEFSPAGTWNRWRDPITWTTSTDQKTTEMRRWRTAFTPNTCWTQKMMFGKCWVTKQFLVPIDFHSYCFSLSVLWMSMATINYTVSQILQNIFFCVQQKKETHTWGWINVFIFRWTVSLRRIWIPEPLKVKLLSSNLS